VSRRRGKPAGRDSAEGNDTGWVIVPNLWGGIIAPPGYLKSPVIQMATRPLNLIQTEWRREHEEALEGVRAGERAIRTSAYGMERTVQGGIEEGEQIRRPTGREMNPENRSCGG
jgi:hypothetical protein